MVKRAYCLDKPDRPDSGIAPVSEDHVLQRWQRYCECVLHGPIRASALLERVKLLPDVDLAKVIKDRPLLVVAPHPDDESLGCGGLIRKTTQLGGKVHLVIVTDGAKSHPQSRTHPHDRLRRLRHNEALEAAAALGVPAGQVSFLNVPDGHAPHFGRAARALGKRLASLAHEVGAKIILTSWNYDTHPDHVAAYRYACRAAQEVGAMLFSYPVWAWTLPLDTVVPNLHLQGFSIDIEHEVAIKRAAVMKHRSQTTSMIADDPSGFTLSDEHLDVMITPREFFILTRGQASHIMAPD